MKPGIGQILPLSCGAVLVMCSLAQAVVLQESFDGAGTSWNNTIFPVWQPGPGRAASGFQKGSLTSYMGAPNTTPSLPISAGSDRAGWYSVYNTGEIDLTASQYQGTDMSIDGYIGIGRTSTTGWPSAGFAARMTSGGNGYLVYFTWELGSATLRINQMRNWIANANYPHVVSSALSVDWTQEIVRLKVEAIGNSIIASAWRVSAIDGQVIETPFQLVGQNTEIRLTDTMFTSGVTGVYAFSGGQNTVFFDDITVNTNIPEPATLLLLGLGGLALRRKL